MGKMRRTLGTVLGVALSFAMFGTQVFAAETVGTGFIDETETVSDSGLLIIDEDGNGVLYDGTGAAEESLDGADGDIIIGDSFDELSDEASEDLLILDEEKELEDAEKDSEEEDDGLRELSRSQNRTWSTNSGRTGNIEDEEAGDLETKDGEPKIITFSQTQVNPIYENEISEEELEQIIEESSEEAEGQSSGLFFTAPSQTFTSIEDVGAYLRQCEKNRDMSAITIKLDLPYSFDSVQDATDYASSAIKKAEEHTGYGYEGDYLRFNRLGQLVRVYYYIDSQGHIILTSAEYTFSHFTDAAMEQQVTDRLNEIYPTLNLGTKSHVGKIMAVYGYITDNITYDYDHLNNDSYLLKHSAYAALINGTAVCQGYAALLYRMLLDNGIDCRVITSEAHAWNIVEISDLYYNLDSTWDANYLNNPESWDWFLKNMNDFVDEENNHYREDEYWLQSFWNDYPMSETSYDYLSESGEAEGGGSGEGGSSEGGSSEGGGSTLQPVTDLRWNSAGWIRYVMPVTGSVYYLTQIITPRGSEYIYDNGSYPNENNFYILECCSVFDEEGTYKFRVKTTTNQSDTDFDSGIVSEWRTWDYHYPANRLSLPTNLRWEGTKAVWNPSTASGSFAGDIYYKIHIYRDGQEWASKGWAVDTYCDLSMYVSDDSSSWTFDVMAYTAQPDEVGPSGFTGRSYAYGQEPESTPGISGLVRNDNGEWYLYDNGVINTSYNGLYEDSSIGWWLVLGGRVATEYNDLYCDANVGWWKITGGQVDFGYTDLYESPTYGWWKINNGSVEFGYNDLYESSAYGWWKINSGSVDFGYNDIYESPAYGWWLISGGSVNFGYTGVFDSPTYGKRRIEGGQVMGPASEDDPTVPGVTGLAQSNNGNWYLYENGVVQSYYSGLYNDENVGWWLIQDGRVAFEYNDLYYDTNHGWWLISGGAVNFGYNDLYCSPTLGWWKIAGGQVDFGYSDLYCSPTCGWWKINNGSVEFGYDDLYGSPTYGWWKVSGGAVDFGYNDLYCSPTYGWWLVSGGQVNFGYWDLYGSPTYGWWKIAGGSVDFGYTDLYDSPSCGWWLVTGGAVDFGYDDVFASPTYDWWKVTGGSVDFGYNGIYNSQRYGTCYINGGRAELRNVS